MKNLRVKYSSWLFLIIAALAAICIQIIPMDSSKHYSATVIAKTDTTLYVRLSFNEQTLALDVKDVNKYAIDEAVIVTDKQLIDGGHNYSIDK